MYKVAFIGAGNISWSLIPAVQQAGCEVIQLISRNKIKLKRFVDAFHIPHFAGDLKALQDEAELIFLTVPDQSIEAIAQELRKKNSIFIHTSGSISLRALKPLGKQIGVFYPMQTFTQQKLVDMSEVPIFIEGHTAEVKQKLLELAKIISLNVFEMDSEDRLKLHIGAVMASNFSNYLYQLINQVLPIQEGINFSIYEGLIREQLEKALSFRPENVQTGPAIRGDQVTIDKHLKLLKKSPEVRDLYLKISQMINADIIDGDDILST